MASILVKHQTGSKANQTEVFDLANFTEVNFGRGDSVQVKYGDQDDLVSRQHAKITKDANNPDQFFLTDSSTNGTFINALRINKGVPAQLNHGDRVQFGVGGPEFIFELDPPPANSARQTRILPDANNSQATREIPAGTREIQPRPEGRLTSLERRIEEERSGMEQRLADERQALNARVMQESIALSGDIERERNNSRWRMIYAGLALFVVAVLSGTGFYIWKMKTEKVIETSQIQLSNAAEIANKATASANEANEKLTKIEAIKTPEQIYNSFSKSTVFIESHWELINESGGKVYQLYVDSKDNPTRNGDFPVYMQYEDEKGRKHIDPVTTDNPSYGRILSNVATVTGSGFAASDNGVILTNRHVAAPWKYLDGSDLKKANGKVYDVKTKVLSPLTNEQEKMLDNWRASASEMFTKSCNVMRKECMPTIVEGRHISLTVTFPGTMDAYAARLVRESNQADVASLKIDVSEAIQGLPPLDSEDTVNAGEPVTVLGYPDLSPKTYVQIQSTDVFRPDSPIKEVPKTTLSHGSVSMVAKMSPDTRRETQNNYTDGLDAYQLTINSTGSGNSGGPVFNSLGKVIGIYTYGSGKVSYAIPIKYGRNLLMISPELKK
jgi:S1-C subfamily serine protease